MIKGEVIEKHALFLGTERPTMAYMESRLEATVNSSCDLQRDRIIESFIGSVSDLIVTGSLGQPQHRCRVRNTFVYCSAANNIVATAICGILRAIHAGVGRKANN